MNWSLIHFFRTPNGSEFGPKVDQYLQETLRDLANSTTNLTFAGLLEACEGEGQGIYSLLELNNLYDIGKLKNWRTDYDIDPIIADVENTIQVSH